jgi:hypothetical protein
MSKINDFNILNLNKKADYLNLANPEISINSVDADNFSGSLKGLDTESPKGCRYLDKSLNLSRLKLVKDSNKSNSEKISPYDNSIDTKDQKNIIEKKNKYTAIIIEITKHDAFSFVLQNFLDNLNDDWNFIIFHNTNNEEFIHDIINNNLINNKNRITLYNLNNINLYSNNYNEILKRKELYSYIPTEIFLTFNTSSLILSQNKDLINDFLDYDYVGAPWKNETIGNGSLSIRKKSKMLEIIAKCEINEKNEDEFFCLQDKVFLRMPSFEKAKQFSVESVFYESSFGIHNCYVKNYLSKIDLDFLFKKYPEIKQLKNLNNYGKKFTIVYKTYFKDLEWLKYSLISLQQFLFTENILELIIYTHDVSLGEVLQLLENMHLKNFISYRVIPVQYNYHGYVKQMVVKANCYKDCKTEYVILLDSDLILKKDLDFESFLKNDDKIEWFYLNKENDPENDVFTVWKKAVEDSTRVPQNIHYMSNGFPFVFTRKSLEDAANKFIEINGCDYENYCGDRCYYEGIKVEDPTLSIFYKLSRIWTEFEYLGFYCHKYSNDYIFIPTNYCRMKDQLNNPDTNSYFIQYWSHGGINESIKKQISSNMKNQKTVIHVFTQSVNNLTTDDVNNFWGLGDIIRGTIALFQLSKKYNFNLIVDTQLHPISNYFKHDRHQYSDFILQNKDNVSFIYPDALENYIINNNENVLFFLTNDLFHEPITDECKEFIKNLLIPNAEFEEYIQSIITSKPPPENYNILHCRLGDSYLVRNDSNNNFNEVKEQIFKYSEYNDILMSDSNTFREDIMINNSNIFLYHIHVAHMGVQFHSKYIKDTLFEFILVTRSKKIKTYSVYSHLSGFVKIVNEIYNIPLVRI